jgi:L-threonylcarbamoyladenylate synthase
VHIAEMETLDGLASTIPEVSRVLTRTFWPGPLTLVFERTRRVLDIVAAGLDSVAVRMPNHPVALALIHKFGRGIVAPSANTSGSPSPTTAQHVYDDLHGKVDLILDSGPTRIGIESTVLDVTITPPVILRKGGLPREQIEAVIGKIGSDVDARLLQRSPGNLYRHYSPKAPVLLVTKGDSESLSAILRRAHSAKSKIGCILHTITDFPNTPDVIVKRVPSNAEELSKVLFDLLRALDKSGVEAIVVEEVDEVGLGTAIMDRLRRASQPVGKQ